MNDKVRFGNLFVCVMVVMGYLGCLHMLIDLADSHLLSAAHTDPRSCGRRVPLQLHISLREAAAQRHLPTHRRGGWPHVEGTETHLFSFSPKKRDFPSLRAKSTLISEPRFSTVVPPARCDFSHARKGKQPFQTETLDKGHFPCLAWEKSHVAGGRKSGLTN